MSTAQIFDRADILKAIENACLLAGGKSAVVIGPQKVGKSYLLEHIYSQSTPTPDTIFCLINLDLLKAFADGGPLTDNFFYAFLVSRLNKRLDVWLEERMAEEGTWKQDIQDTETSMLEIANRHDADSLAQREELEQQNAFRHQQLVDLNNLREIAKLSAAAVAKPIVRVGEVITLLDRLQRAQKRVVLFIDDYQRLLTENGLTNSLFSFLRGANNDGFVVALATSPVHLMDASLHGDGGERPSLFNHFHSQWLGLFSDTEADSFVQWLPNDGLPLTDGEVAYIRSLAGRAPFFLKVVREQFNLLHRPADAAERRDFERTLMPAVEGGFRDIWRRCTKDERRMLREVAANHPIATASPDAKRMEQNGYLLVNGSEAQTFSPLFGTFIERAEDDPEPEIEASVALPHKVFPTALAFSQSDEVEALVVFTLRNPTSQTVKVQIYCELQGFAPRVQRVVTLRRGGSPIQESLSVQIDKEKFRTLDDPGRASLVWGVDLIMPGGNLQQFGDTVFLRLLARDHFVFARRDSQKKLQDYTWLIAAWVQKNEPGLIPIRQAARDIKTLEGSAVDNPDEIRAYVKALYDAVQKHGLTYDNSALVFHQGANDFVQRVRTPGRVLRESAANCIEGAVLFASLLSASDLSPIILFTPGHAIVGWKAGRSAGAGVEFLETTVIANEPFEEALQLGQANCLHWKIHYDEWQAKQPAFIADPAAFAIPVDVHAASKAHWLVPIPAGD